MTPRLALQWFYGTIVDTGASGLVLTAFSYNDPEALPSPSGYVREGARVTSIGRLLNFPEQELKRGCYRGFKGR